MLLKNRQKSTLYVMVYGEFAQEKPVELSKLLAKVTPEPLEVTYLVNSGAEAIDKVLNWRKDIQKRRNRVISSFISWEYPRCFECFWE